jgi:competence protein ComEA
VKASYTRREAIVAGLFGVAVAGIVWGPVVLRPFGSPDAIHLQTLRLPDDQPIVHARISPASVGATKTKPTSRVDINHADIVALQRLPGIGPTLAQRIITHRKAYGPFAGPRGLLEVEGIGSKRFDKIESWIEAR